MFRQALLLMLTAATLGAAEELVYLDEQPVPFSVWLDFPALSRPNVADPALPIWFESFQAHVVQATDSSPPKTIFRLHLRRLPSLHREMLVRVFFDDLPEMQPVVSAWSEAGKERFRSAPLGTGLGLPTSESVVIPLAGTDYLDIEVAGNGTSVRGALASTLKDVTTRQTMDFHPPAEVVDPFGNLPPAQPAEEDRKLFGRFKATLDHGTVRLSTDEPDSVWDFELTARPLVAVVTFEILNADLTAPPIILANDGEPAYAQVHWPDLADPGFRGEARGTEPHMRFQYTGWLRAQAVIPAGVLKTGLNKVTVGLSDQSGPVAIRNVELQLKQNWKHFDYILSPKNP